MDPCKSTRKDSGPKDILCNRRDFYYTFVPIATLNTIHALVALIGCTKEMIVFLL